MTGEARNSIVGGSDLLVQNKGIWYGGGNDLVFKNQSATGIMTWFSKDVFTSSVYEALVGQFLTLNNCTYAVTVTFMATTWVSHTPVYNPDKQYSIQTYSLIVNIGGTATGDIPHNRIIDVDPGAIGPMELVWRTDTTNSAVINLYVRNLNGTYPSDQIYWTAQVNVTQNGSE